jgi:nicotinate-nucleotide pyrophosphorylase (carboxylating)
MSRHAPSFIVADCVARAVAEDLGGRGDVTSDATIEVGRQARFAIHARTSGVLAGTDPAMETFRQIDSSLIVDWALGDGGALAAGDCIATISGSVHSVLAGERTALNFLGRLSGIATTTRAFVDAVEGTGAVIAHTRKTTPGLRALELAAVVAGGGGRHRFGLDDAVLIKDNHVAIAGGVGAAVRTARTRVGHMTKVAVEIDALDQLAEVLDAGADSVLLDNFSPEALSDAVQRAAGHGVMLEASGGIALNNVRAIAETGVDVISVGAITHSAPCLDLGLDAID